MVRALLAVLVWLAAQATAAAEPAATLPYRIDYGGWFTVSATVNGEGPYDFILDTGASHSLVFENLAALQTFPPSGGPQQLVLGLSSSGYYPTHVIGDIAVGPLELNDAATVILGDWTVAERSPQGVLGLDFLARYRIVIDAERREISFYPPAQDVPARYGRWKEAALKPTDFGREAGQLYTVSALVNRARVEFMLDLGAAGTVINRLAYVRARPDTISLRMLGGGASRINKVTDALDEEVAARHAPFRRVKAGEMVWRNVVFVVHDSQIFAELGVSAEPFGLMGADLFRTRSFVLDFPGERLLIGPKIEGRS